VDSSAAIGPKVVRRSRWEITRCAQGSEDRPASSGRRGMPGADALDRLYGSSIPQGHGPAADAGACLELCVRPSGDALLV